MKRKKLPMVEVRMAMLMQIARLPPSAVAYVSATDYKAFRDFARRRPMS